MVAFAGDVVDRDRQDGVAPAHLVHLDCDVRHLRRREAALEGELAGIDREFEDRAVQHRRLGLALDGEGFGQEHCAPLLHLLDAFVADRRHPQYRIGHHQHRPDDQLRRAPEARHLHAHALGPALALADQPAHQCHRHHQDDDQDGDQHAL